MKASIILTSINVPHLLLGYADNFEKYNHRDDIGFTFIPDRKTPEKAKDIIDKLKKRKFDAEYHSLKSQDNFFERFPKLKKICLIIQMRGGLLVF